MADAVPPPASDATSSRLSTITLPKVLFSILLAVQAYFLLPRLQDDFRGVSNWIYDTPTVKLPQGSYVGKTLESNNHHRAIHAWLGIQYAQPPVGDLRFARPVPVKEGNSTVNAFQYGFRCPGKQLLKLDGVPDLEQDEDCLTVNIFKQKGRPSSKKVPVVVYLHGGAFNRGFAAMHDTASMLAWATEPFVAVSFNYRIGALGFMNSKLTAKEGLLNLGLRDQILLLKWVQENIAAFGGNKDDVTLVGLSAGAHSVGHHILNINQKSKLFHKAVIESGGATSRAVHPADSALHDAQFREFLKEVGCGGKAEQDVLPCLRAAPTGVVVSGQLAVFDKYDPSVRWAWQPVIDGDIISRRPVDAWKSGEWHKVPILTGFNHNEGTMYVPKSMQTGDEFTTFFKTLLPQLSARDLAELETLYPDPDNNSASPYADTRNFSALGIGPQFKRVQEAYGQYAYVCPVRQTAHLASADQDAKIWLYHWALNRTVLGGANHADQMHYETMSPKVRSVSQTHEMIARSFHAYITSFILTGDPSKVPGRAPRRPIWRRFRVERGDVSVMKFGSGNDEAAGGTGLGTTAAFVRDRWGEEQCRFWWEKSEAPED